MMSKIEQASNFPLKMLNYQISDEEYPVRTISNFNLKQLSTALNCATYEITIKLQTAFHQQRKTIK